jgi:hypothetical protein
MIAQEFTLWDTPGKRQNLHCLVSSHLRTDPTNVIKKAFSDGPTVVSRPRVGVVGRVGHFTQKRVRTGRAWTAPRWP